MKIYNEDPNTLNIVNDENTHALNVVTNKDSVSVEVDGKTISSIITNISDSTVGEYAVQQKTTTAEGKNSFSEGLNTTASSNYSHAEGQKSKAGNETIDPETLPVEKQVNTEFGASHAEGFATLAKPIGSHSEGYKTQAIGFASHAEGNSSQAKGINSHAEGVLSETMPPTGSGAIAEWRDGYAAHAEGHITTAGGRASHTEGDNTVTNNPSEHAEGRYNISHYVDNSSYGNSGNTQHSIGIGSGLENRKNAFEVMQNGDIYIIGLGGYDGTNPDSAQSLQQILQATLN